ncbi:transporter [Vibrio coralliilyticus]|uniref:Transporter n=1 Tax=Vibrio coralliilyticus TaxID=190893 RepID=A0AAN0SKL9_9VIBR|nr:ABC transporter substrate-binding protein [Vibrio coralliilyticus]AIW22901.1 transporter [Vibrio coralliilyticus]NOH38341.1 transporter [Vibrio coralliilyticus]NOH55235.1 transporter [Vibrio coralliilyticus]
MKNDLPLRRLDQMLSHYQLGQSYEVTLGELEEVFFTIRRNASSILKTLQQKGWIDWTPGVGRGKASQLVVRVSLETALSEAIRGDLATGRFDRLAKYVQSYQSLAPQLLRAAMQETDEWQRAHNALTVTHYPYVRVLTPSDTYWSAELQVSSALYDTLLRIDEHGFLVDHLAFDHAINDDGTIYRFWLRPNVKCHDGLPLTPEDVVSSLRRLRDTNGPFQWLFRQVVSVRWESACQAVVITLEGPNPLFIYALTTANASITSQRPRTYAQGTCFIGTGPLQLEAWEPHQLTLKRNAHYFADSALLSDITLFHQGSELDRVMSLHHEGETSEQIDIHAYSILAANPTASCPLDPDDIQALMAYVAAQRPEHTERTQLRTVHHFDRCWPETANRPSLRGRVVLGHPAWRLHYKQALVDWVVATLERTGLEVTCLTLDNLDDLSTYRPHVDFLLTEEILEPPLEYGLYDWLLTSGVLRYCLAEPALERHRQQVQGVMAQYSGRDDLLALIAPFVSERRILPLFYGRKIINRHPQIAGLHMKSNGYLDLHRLWIQTPDTD